MPRCRDKVLRSENSETTMASSGLTWILNSTSGSHPVWNCGKNSLEYLLKMARRRASSWHPRVGLSTYPGNGEDAEALIKNADTAMYHAKQSGRDNYQLLRADMSL